MLTALSLADPAAPRPSSSPSSPSPSFTHRSSSTSRSYRRRLFTDAPATTFRPFAQQTATPSTLQPSPPTQTHPLYYFASTPEKILDAPGTSDDYYASRLDWSSRNLVSVGLSSDTYLWHPNSGESTLLPPVSNSNATSRVTALTFTPSGEHLTVGIDAGVVAHYDVATHTRLRSGKPTFPASDHLDLTSAKLANLGVAVTRTTCMTYVSATTLLTGDATGRILLWDMRAPLASVPATLRRVHAPGNPVCGLAANDDGVTFASGGNDGVVCVWDARRLDKPVVTWKEAHVGAVRALAWCPLRANVLATGGGTADARIKYRDTLTRRSFARMDTGGQVTALRFLKRS
ncbi:quinon protein alcohol dehydrogenase-like superfamily, partial [Catenaria anguillulae PL171]